MIINRIFDDISVEDSLLWTVVYDGAGKNEFDSLFDSWTDTEILEEFFTLHEKELDTVFWGHISIDEAVLKTIEEAEHFELMIYEIAHGNQWKNKTGISDIFKPLVKQSYDARHRRKYKARPDIRHPFLRLYAVRLEDDVYIITGGAIKLTDKMDGHEHLQYQLKRLDIVKQYLTSEGISYIEDLIIE